MVEIINGDCLEVICDLPKVDCVFADPPDNIGLRYSSGDDNLPIEEYNQLLSRWFNAFMGKTDCLWLSFNARHVATMGYISSHFMAKFGHEWEFKPCVQTFNFGNHNRYGLTNCHRPLWLFHKGVLDPSAAMVPSVRGMMSDGRAKNGGTKTPGDVFEFCRVQGNNKQRRKWHPTQLNEGLVERCIRLTTKEGDHVLDPFGGTGTTARVCQRINRHCTLIEISPKYCDLIRKDIT